MSSRKFTHIKNKKINMVNISGKKNSLRKAKAMAFLTFDEKTFQHIKEKGSPKGEIFSTAKIAGIQAAKKKGS